MFGTALILISIATAVAVIFNSFFAYLRNKSNSRILLAHLEAGHPLDDNLLNMLNQKGGEGIPDIRKAILLISLGIAGMLFSGFAENPESVQLAQGMSLFPIVLGIGFLVSMWIEKRMAG